ncbi:MAG: DNA repair exonuclease, partial [Pirellulaceae bacterium]|nr:DNA repair exonuclease [Pirellulaceae bacterium]
STGLFFVKQLARLGAAEIPVFMIAGNHDAVGKMTRSLPLPKNVTLLGAKKAESARLEQLQVAIHGHSFAAAAVPDNMVPSYPPAVRGWFNIGLLHTSLDMEAGGEHACYAPCKLADLEAKGYDYWALGHVHQRAIRSQSPLVAYPGNLQGRHIRETGAKGCLLVTVDDSHTVRTDFQALDVFRWEHCLVDATGAVDGDELLLRFQNAAALLNSQHDEMPLALRATFRGRCAAHAELARAPDTWVNQVRAKAMEVGGGNVWVEKVRLETAAEVEQQVASEDGPLGELAELVREICDSPQLLDELYGELADLKGKLPPELAEGEGALKLADHDWLRRLVREAQPLLVGRLHREKTA